MRKKRILIIFTSLVFIAVCVLGCSMLFSVSEIDIIKTSEITQFEIERVNQELKMYKGKNIFTLSKDEIKTKMTKNIPYVKVESIEKKFPGTLEVKISERQEVFALKIADSYYNMDDDGYILSITTENKNNVDKTPNIEIKGLDEKSFINYKIGEKFQSKSDDYFDSCCKAVKNILLMNFSSEGVRDLFQSITINTMLKKSDFQTNIGVMITIDTPNDKIIEKTDKAMGLFLSLTETEKMGGQIIINSTLIPSYIG